MDIFGQKPYTFLKERGLIYQSTGEKEIEKLLNGKPITFYLGIDPTADGIHIGHLCSLRTFRYLQEAGHRGVLIIGGATAMIGDPTGKQDMRSMLTPEVINKNFKQVESLCKKFINTEGKNAAIILNNNDWMKNYGYIEFMRDVGMYFNVNVMLSAEAYKKRIASGGLTFLEMGYMLVQAYDFEYLSNKYNCVLQVGGSDQWGNMVAGTELMRKKKGRMLNVFTTPLLLNANGEKMGKTAGGALWATEGKTSVYDFYQYFINVDDRDIETLLRWFSDFSTEKIKEICEGDIRTAKRIMAFEVTKLIHGEQNALAAEKTAEEIFSGKGQSENMPTVNMSKADFGEGMNVTEFLEKIKIVSSRSEARRLIEQGGILLDDIKVTDVKMNIVPKSKIIVKKGKKVYIKVLIS